jgi:hypothetical protein
MFLYCFSLFFPFLANEMTVQEQVRMHGVFLVEWIVSITNFYEHAYELMTTAMENILQDLVNRTTL